MKTFNDQDKTRQPTSWPGLTGGQDLGDGDDRYLPSNSSPHNYTIISRHICCKSSLGGTTVATLQSQQFTPATTALQDQ